MTVSNLMIRTSRLSLLKLPTSQEDTQSATMPFCQLKWRANKLWVKRVEQSTQAALPALESQQWLKACLEHSPINAVCLDPSLGEQVIQNWADACEKAGKLVFLRVPPNPNLPKQKKPRIWRIKRTFDWLLAALFLAALSPVLISLMLFIHWSNADDVLTKEWAIGHRGRLFRLYKLNVVAPHQERPPIMHWIQRCGLDKLPQLLHVIHGRMSLVGPRTWSLAEATHASPKSLHHLKALPGVTGAKQLIYKLSFCDKDREDQPEQVYLASWTLTRDFEFLLLAIPKVLLGFSTY